MSNEINDYKIGGIIDLTKVPVFIIFLLNFLIGVPAYLVLTIFAVLYFRIGLFGPPLHPPAFEYRALAVLVIVGYLCLPVLVTKWLISNSPYRFEYWVASLSCFTVGVMVSFIIW